MQDNFESKKNMQAGTYTALICGGLLLLFIFVRWTLPPIPEPPAEEGLEVNLGSSDMGMGDDQPFEPGSPAPAQSQPAYVPPAPAPVQEEPSKDIPEDNDPDAAEIKKPTVTKPDATKTHEKDVVKSKPVVKPVETPPAPPAPKPKAVFKGVNGTGTGGNEADSYKKGGNQGIAGGRGDQGSPGGNPNSDNYKGGGNGSGVAISRGLTGRRITALPSFTDDFNDNAKVSIDIKVDESGRVTSATYQLRGSTTSDAGMIEIAKRKAMQVKFSPGESESAGTILFNFKLRN